VNAGAVVTGKTNVRLYAGNCQTCLPHDHRPDLHERTRVVNGETAPSLDVSKWVSLATLAALPATVALVGRTRAGPPSASGS